MTQNNFPSYLRKGDEPKEEDSLDTHLMVERKRYYTEIQRKREWKFKFQRHEERNPVW